MTWWGRRKDDPPTAKPPDLPELPASNVVTFPDKKVSDLNRLAVHALLDKLLDEIAEDEFLVMGIESSSGRLTDFTCSQEHIGAGSWLNKGVSS